MSKYRVSTDFEFPGISGPRDIGKVWTFECDNDLQAIHQAYGWLVGVGATFGIVGRMSNKGALHVIKEYTLGQKLNHVEAVSDEK